MLGALIRQAWITRADLRANPGRLYLFGDNLAERGDVVVPADGLGTGLAQLDRRAPRIAALIADEIAELERFAAEGRPMPQDMR